MKHKYIKSFEHLINLINSVITYLPDEDVENIMLNGGFGDAKFYYDNVYLYPYCDTFAYHITKVSPNYLSIQSVEEERYSFEQENEAYGKKYYYKKYLVIPENLKGK